MARPWVPGSGSEVNPQVRVLWLSILKNPAGMWISGFQSRPPASISNTLVPRAQIFGQPFGQDAPGRAGADDDVIRLHALRSHPMVRPAARPLIRAHSLAHRGGTVRWPERSTPR